MLLGERAETEKADRLIVRDQRNGQHRKRPRGLPLAALSFGFGGQIVERANAHNFAAADEAGDPWEGADVQPGEDAAQVAAGASPLVQVLDHQGFRAKSGQEGAISADMSGYRLKSLPDLPGESIFSRVHQAVGDFKKHLFQAQAALQFLVGMLDFGDIQVAGAAALEFAARIEYRLADVPEPDDVAVGVPDADIHLVHGGFSFADFEVHFQRGPVGFQRQIPQQVRVFGVLLGGVAGEAFNRRGGVNQPAGRVKPGFPVVCQIRHGAKALFAFAQGQLVPAAHGQLALGLQRNGTQQPHQYARRHQRDQLDDGFAVEGGEQPGRVAAGLQEQFQRDHRQSSENAAAHAQQQPAKSRQHGGQRDGRVVHPDPRH